MASCKGVQGRTALTVFDSFMKSSSIEAIKAAGKNSLAVLRLSVPWFKVFSSRYRASCAIVGLRRISDTATRATTLELRTRARSIAEMESIPRRVKDVHLPKSSIDTVADSVIASAISKSIRLQPPSSEASLEELETFSR